MGWGVDTGQMRVAVNKPGQFWPGRQRIESTGFEIGDDRRLSRDGARHIPQVDAEQTTHPDENLAQLRIELRNVTQSVETGDGAAIGQCPRWTRLQR